MYALQNAKVNVEAGLQQHRPMHSVVDVIVLHDVLPHSRQRVQATRASAQENPHLTRALVLQLFFTWRHCVAGRVCPDEFLVFEPFSATAVVFVGPATAVVFVGPSATAVGILWFLRVETLHALPNSASLATCQRFCVGRKDVVYILCLSIQLSCQSLISKTHIQQKSFNFHQNHHQTPQSRPGRLRKSRTASPSLPQAAQTPPLSQTRLPRLRGEARPPSPPQ